jgi:tRNA(Ile)-lysidine synthase
VKLRQGGETGRWHGHQREIKKLLQQWHIPPWLRAYLPLLYVQDALASIPNLMICDNFTVAPHEFGWLIHWEDVEKFGGGTISSRAV